MVRKPQATFVQQLIRKEDIGTVAASMVQEYSNRGTRGELKVGNHPDCKKFVARFFHRRHPPIESLRTTLLAARPIPDMHHAPVQPQVAAERAKLSVLSKHCFRERTKLVHQPFHLLLSCHACAATSVDPRRWKPNISGMRIVKQVEPIATPLERGTYTRTKYRDDPGIVVRDRIDVVDAEIVRDNQIFLALVSGKESPSAIRCIVGLLPIAVSDHHPIHGNSISRKTATVPERQRLDLVSSSLEFFRVHAWICQALGDSALPESRKH
jgi:hypothetical protein